MSNDDSYREAVILATYMVKEFYNENPKFILTDSTTGVILQINNMVTGLKRDKSFKEKISTAVHKVLHGKGTSKAAKTKAGSALTQRIKK